MTIHLRGKLVGWGTQMKKKPCRPLVKFLHKVFTYNLLRITHRNELTFQMTYLIDAILNDKSIDISSIIYYMMINAASKDHAMGSFPFLIMLTKTMLKEKVPFNVGVVLHRRNPPITMGYL